MVTQLQTEINSLRESRKDEYPGSNLQLYEDAQKAIDEQNLCSFQKLNKSQREDILNIWIKQNHVPVDYALNNFRYVKICYTRISYNRSAVKKILNNFDLLRMVQLLKWECNHFQNFIFHSFICNIS